jgi:hypothetical protein
MTRLRRQEGASLILLIGIIATLAIMAVALVTLMSNQQQFSHSDQTRTQAFNVAEGALDVGMATLKAAWPAPVASPSPEPSPSFNATAFRNEYSLSEFPNPSSGQFINAVFFDNSDTNGDGNIDPNDAHYDANNDNLMYMQASAKCGNGSARIQVEVQRTFWNPTFPHGVAVYASGDLVSNGGGNNPKISVEVPPASGPTASVLVAGTISDPSVTDQQKITTVTGSNVPPVSQVISPSIIANITATAQMAGRYFSGSNALNDALNSPASGMGGPGLQGLTVIVPPAGTSGTVELPANTIDTPAVTLLLGGNNWNFDMRGHTDYYGFCYTTGNLDFSAGTPCIHGTIVTLGSVGLRGTADVLYNDNVLMKLSTMWTLNVRLVPNTWRELSAS